MYTAIETSYLQEKIEEWTMNMEDALNKNDIQMYNAYTYGVAAYQFVLKFGVQIPKEKIITNG